MMGYDGVMDDETRDHICYFQQASAYHSFKACNRINGDKFAQDEARMHQALSAAYSLRVRRAMEIE